MERLDDRAAEYVVEVQRVVPVRLLVPGGREAVSREVEPSEGREEHGNGDDARERGTGHAQSGAPGARGTEQRRDDSPEAHEPREPDGERPSDGHDEENEPERGNYDGAMP